MVGSATIIFLCVSLFPVKFCCKGIFSLFYQHINKWQYSFFFSVSKEIDINHHCPFVSKDLQLPVVSLKPIHVNFCNFSRSRLSNWTPISLCPIFSIKCFKVNCLFLLFYSGHIHKQILKNILYILWIEGLWPARDEPKRKKIKKSLYLMFRIFLRWSEFSHYKNLEGKN